MIALPRNDLRTKVVKGSEIQEVLHSSQDLKTYLLSLYECQYQTFFQKLGEYTMFLSSLSILSIPLHLFNFAVSYLCG